MYRIDQFFSPVHAILSDNSIQEIVEVLLT